LSANEKPSQHVKLILLGPAGIGKSVLRQLLLRGDSMTIGATPREQRINLVDADFDLSVLDFANLSSHEIFFSAYSYYLILWDMRKRDPSYIDEHVQYWIDLIQAKVPGSTILIIGTYIYELAMSSQDQNRAPSNSILSIADIKQMAIYQEAEKALWQQLDTNESNRVNDINRQISSLRSGKKQANLARLLENRPKIFHNVVPLHLSATNLLLATPRNDRRVNHSQSSRELYPSTPRSSLARSSAAGSNLFSPSSDIDDYRSISRIHSESDVNRLITAPSSTLSLRHPPPQNDLSATPSGRFSNVGDQYDLTGISELLNVIVEFLHETEQTLVKIPPYVECIQYRKYLERLKTEYATRNKPPYCTLQSFEQYLFSEVDVDRNILDIVTEYWATLGLIMKFDFNSGSEENKAFSKIYLVLDPSWLRECLSGLEDMKNEILTSNSFKSNHPSPSVSKRWERDHRNGFRVWADISTSLIHRSASLSSLTDYRLKADTTTLLRRILQSLSIIIPSGFRPLDSNEPNLRDRSASLLSDDNLMFLVPSLMKAMPEGEGDVMSQQYPKAGCIQLEKRVYLSKFFVPPDVIPRILAKVYSDARRQEVTNDQMNISNDNTPRSPPTPANAERNFMVDSSGASNSAGLANDLGMFYCWKTAFSQEIDHITVSVYLSTSSPQSVSSSSHSDDHSLPTVGPFISITTTSHVLLIHNAVRLMNVYWRAVRDVLNSFPGLEYYKYSLCPICLMKQRRAHDCGAFDDNASCDSSDDDDEEEEDIEPEIESDDDTGNEHRLTHEQQLLALDADEPIPNLLDCKRSCPKGCAIRYDFWKAVKPHHFHNIYPSEAEFQRGLIEYISSQTRKPDRSCSIAMSAIFIPSSPTDAEDIAQTESQTMIDEAMKESLVDIRAYKFNESKIRFDEDRCHQIIEGELESSRYNGYYFAIEDRRFVITSVMPPRLGEAKNMRYIYIVERHRSDTTIDGHTRPASSEIFAAHVLDRRYTYLTKRESLFVGARGNASVTSVRQAQEFFSVLEVVAEVELKNIETKEQATIISVPMDPAKNLRPMTQQDYRILLQKQLNLFTEGRLGSTVYILSFDKQRQINITYGRIIRHLPKVACGHLRGISLVSTKAAMHFCVPGAIVIDCVTNSLIGIVLIARNKIDDVYFVATP
jgi:hypothetical protein